MEVFRATSKGQTLVRAMSLLGVLLCLFPAVSGVADVTITSKFPYIPENAYTWLYCYHTGTIVNQRRYQFGLELDTGSGLGFISARNTYNNPWSVRVWYYDSRNNILVNFTNAISCIGRQNGVSDKVITFKMREDADVKPRLFSRTVNVGDAVTLEMVRNPASTRTGDLEWRKNGVVLQDETALTLNINNVQSSDEGIYECYYGGAYSDRKQGIMRLIVRACAENKYGSDCSNDCPDCYNGGVCHDQTGECVCPPGFMGTYCETACASGRFGKTCRFNCSGGCQGQLMTVPDPVGCTCPPGLTGMTCQDACPDGTYGASCTQTCHCLSGNSACNKETGACTGGCAAGWEGNSCQIRPATVTQHPVDQTINIGSQATFTCISTGVPTPAITWYNDSSAITPGGQISLVEVIEVVNGEDVVTGILTITSVGREDNGVYKCASSNANGVYIFTSQAARLIVRERPDDVTLSVTAVNSTALQVTWTVGVTGNLDILDSQVRYRSRINDEWAPWTPWISTGISGTNGTVRISGLLPAVRYGVQVTVGNALGWSFPPSWASGTTDEAPPGPPHGLQAAQISHDTVHLTWQPPLRTNGVIRSYTVQYGESGTCETAEFSHQVTTSDGSTTTVIGDLVPYTNYTFRVRGATSAGGGDFSNCSVTRTLGYYPTAPVVQTFADQHDCNCRTPNLPRPVQLRVAWRRPDHIHGQLQAYRISLYNRTGGEPFYQENMTSGLQQENLAAVVTSSLLQPANNYSVTISAINTVYRGRESHPYIARTSDGCPNAPTVTKLASSECGVNWTAPTATRGRLTGYNVIYVDTPLHDPDESEPGTSYAPLGLDEQQWSKSLAELPANSLVTVTVRAVTCAGGNKGEEVTCRVSRVEPPPPPVLPTGPPPIASATSFPMVLPKVNERNGPVRCCQVIVITMTKTESLADLKTRVGEPDVMLTEDAPDGGKTEPYVALSLSTDDYKRTDAVQIGDGGPCGHEWCCERSELADPRRAQTPGNKKLQSGGKYTAAVRCYVDSGARRRKRNTKKLFTTSGYIEPVITEMDNQEETVPLVPIIAGVAAALLVAVLVTVGIICYKKRKANDDQHAPGVQLDLKIIKGDEPSATESAENPACKTLDEDNYLYETTIYCIQDLVTVDDVVEFLRCRGFGQYAAAFRRHKIDGDVVSNLSDAVLAELIPEIGPRVKLQKALQELKDNSDSAESSKPVHADWEIPRSSLTLGKVLGKGQFGEVRLGELRKRGVTLTVAVKTLKASAEDRDKEDLLGELEILVTVGRHDNIISLVGACTVEGPLALVVEYAPNGCLKDWLKDNRPEEMDQTDDKNIPTSGVLLPMDQLILFGIDIANGMSHLAAMQCVHRDLAARNVLLGKDLTAKISDFGLSRDIYEESEYVKSTKSQLPVRWMAYESLFYHTYTTQSDVWSFGVLLWEIMTMGKKPYGRMTGKELMKLLPDGYRLEKPALCPQEIYDVMRCCWETLPENRPTFPDLKVTLDRIIQDYKTYASLLK